MSRIGKAPIAIPSGVNVTVADNIVTVKGPKGELKQNIHPEIQVNVAAVKSTWSVLLMRSNFAPCMVCTAL